MENKDSLFDNIRNAPEEEAREKYDNLKKTALRGAALAIISRNFSHGIGQHIRKLAKKAH
jgi:hypothetical protein